MLALAGLAASAALIANALAPPARRLAWLGAVLPPPAALVPSLLPNPPAPPAPAPEPEKPKALPSPPPGLRTPASPPVMPPAPTASGPIREVNGAEAWKAFQSGVPFLDARRSAEYAEGHVAGAFCTPVWESDLEDRLIGFKATRRPGPDDPIVIYCSGGDCKDSHLLADRLLKEGYFHLLIYRDGFPDWVARKHPIEKGQP